MEEGTAELCEEWHLPNPFETPDYNYPSQKAPETPPKAPKAFRSRHGRNLDEIALDTPKWKKAKRVHFEEKAYENEFRLFTLDENSQM